MTTRKGRSHGRPLATKRSMHLVLRSSAAKGDWSMNKPSNRLKVAQLIEKFARKNHIRIHSYANVGNHLHIHIQLSRIASYRPFIRGLTAAIAMAITGLSRWSDSGSLARVRLGGRKFWDYRPFSRVVTGRRDFVGVNDYVAINQIEGSGIPRKLGSYALQQIRVWQKVIDEIKRTALRAPLRTPS